MYAAGEPGRSSRRILQVLGRAAPHDSLRFKRQKELLGYCSVTNVLAGEFFRQHGDHGAAEREFREIAEREHDNPWGWYLLGELYDELGEKRMALECYRAVLRTVPEHGPSRQALQAKKKRGHDGPAPY